jgi:hypothetical protein
MSERVYKGDIGSIIELNMQEDISAATGILLYIKLPSGQLDQWSASIYGTDYLRHTTVDGDLSEAGVFLIQPYMTIGGWTGYGKTVKLDVRSRYS